jgi:predicted HicB family RNase H-like nuclease
MNTIKYKDYTAKVDFDSEDEIFVGKVIGINDIISFHAKTVEELNPAFHDAINHYLEACKFQKGKSK